MVLKIIDDNQQMIDVEINEGDIYLLPAGVPHSPQRKENTKSPPILCTFKQDTLVINAITKLKLLHDRVKEAKEHNDEYCQIILINSERP